MTDAELYKLYRQTAHAEDIAFFIRVALPDPAITRQLAGLRGKAMRSKSGRLSREDLALFASLKLAHWTARGGWSTQATWQAEMDAIMLPAIEPPAVNNDPGTEVDHAA